MNEKVTNIKKELDVDLENIKSTNDINELKVKYMGKKGLITELTSNMAELSIDEKKEVGRLSNELKNEFLEQITNIESSLKEKELNEKLEKDRIDVTMPASKVVTGAAHPLTKVTEELEELFISMGYDVVSGPEVESDLYSFEMLNLPKGHPARDAQDSFYITDDMLLRPHTSPVQIRTMLSFQEKKPFRIICPGKVYRRDDDATHSHQFSQIEGLVVGYNISLAHLKGTLEEFAKRMFGRERTVRFRPSFFPFTEPSYEVDVSCFKCGGAGCNLCKGTGWIEILGSGMVHPNVLNGCGFDAKVFTGFAFGMGIERIAMLKYGITDIRDLYTNDLRFLNTYNRKDGGNNDEAK